MGKAMVVSEAGGIYSVEVHLGLSSVMLRCKGYEQAHDLADVLNYALLDGDFGPESEA